MKVLVTSTGRELESQVDPRFGRAQFFVVVDSESGAFEVVDNEQNLNAAQGAGIQAAKNAAEAGAEVVLTENVGPRAFSTLKATGIKVHVGAKGTVAEAVSQFKAGELKAADDANVAGHWA